MVALELLCACRALEFRRPLTAGAGSERLYAAMRRRVPTPEGDRPFSGDVRDGWRAAMLAGELSALSEEVLTS